jgi:hypothetical protein
MAKKTYTVKKTINGTEYIAQFNGISAALDAVDNCYIPGTQNISASKMAKYLFEHVIVEPKNLTADDFDSLEELNEVTDFAREVMQGNFRDTADEGAAKKKG